MPYLYNEERREISKDFNLMNLLGKNGSIYDQYEILYLMEDGDDCIGGLTVVQIAKWERKTGWQVYHNQSLQAILTIHEFSSVVPKKYWDPKILVAIATRKEVKINPEKKIIGIIDDYFGSFHNIWEYIEVKE